MNMKHFLAASATVAALTVGAPAFAQSNSIDEAGPGSADDNTIVEVYDVLDLLSNNGNNSDNSSQDQDNDNNGNNRGNGSSIVAFQLLNAVNNNSELDEVVDLDGEDATETAVGYNSGNNTVNGSAFAAYAGILNQAWNTGINANTQAATNIAAQGTVNFGSQGGADDAGGGGGGGD